MNDRPLLSRRRLIHALGAVGLGATGLGVFAPAHATARRALAPDCLELVSLHTGESLVVPCTADAAPGSDALRGLQHLLRDHRNGEEHPIDAALYPQLLQLAAAARVDARYEIISGYRSPVTNRKLHEGSKGVASRSLHLEGRALDVRLKGVDCLRVAELARGRQWGGVGYYRSSAFVHLDTGRVRTWNG
jgi:uncharacterized protein YcbK (DUF882 family)